MTQNDSHNNGSPSPNGDERNPTTGRFQPGNSAAAGHAKPHATKVSQLRAELLNAVTPDDMRAAVDALRREAEQGNVQAIRELLDRTIGKVTEPQRLEVNAGDQPLIQIGRIEAAKDRLLRMADRHATGQREHHPQADERDATPQAAEHQPEPPPQLFGASRPGASRDPPRKWMDG